MKNLYLALAVIGFVLPNIFVAMETFENGNILLYTDLEASFSALFDNYIVSAFTTDTLVLVMVFFIWSYHEAKKLGIRKIAWLWPFTMLFGLAFGLTFFLYLRERALEAQLAAE